MMTDDEIQENLNKYFAVSGKISIENGLVSCTGDVKLDPNKPVTQLPVKFKSVGGSFVCYFNNLKSLTGAPRVVGGSFVCYFNNLKSLTGAPQVVGGVFGCANNPLESLTGTPAIIRGNFCLSYSKDLPLLPLLMMRGVKKFMFIFFLDNWLTNQGVNYQDTNQDLAEILNRYKNTGTRGMLACAEEMLNAGYGSNANL